MDELRVAETDTIEPDFIEECPLCGLFRYPNDPKHIDICHLHVFCHVCQRFEGAYFGVDRCDGLPTMDEQLMLSAITEISDPIPLREPWKHMIHLIIWFSMQTDRSRSLSSEVTQAF